jgi:uncharacterized membrane protein
MNIDDSNWKYGLFYFNTNDTRVWLPKRNPWMGFTLNWAKPMAYVYLIIILILGLCVPFLC